MHKLHLESAIVAAVDGEGVLIVAQTHDEARSIAGALLDICDENPGLVKQACWTNGRERIDLATGGGFRFTSLGSRGMRGWSADRLFVPISTPAEQLRDLLPALAASRVGLVTGY